jgi:hypothetical protein
VQKFPSFIVSAIASWRDGGPMDWLMTDENLATAIVLAGFCLFSLVMCRLAR